MPAMLRVITRKLIWIPLLSAAVAATLAVWLLLPWIVREQVKTALRNVGVDDIEHLNIDYAWRDLLGARVDQIKLTGGTFTIRKQGDRIIFGRISGGKGSGPQSSDNETLPLRRVELSDSRVRIESGEKTIELKLSGEVVAAGSTIDFKLRADENSGDISGHFDIASGTAQIISTIDPAAANKAIAIVAVLGSLSAVDKLSVHKGVFHIDAKFGEPGSSARIKLDNVELQETKNDVVVEGLNGTLELTSLAPLATAADQKFTASRVKFGETELVDGSLIFSIERSAALVRETRWSWLGGEVAAKDFKIAPGEPTRMMLEVLNVSLRDVLKTFAQGKVEGDGKLSGQLPMEISAAGVNFGEGALAARGAGELKIVDESLTAPVAAAAGKSVGEASQEQVKRNIMNALKDFRFERLTAKLQQEPQGLVGYVHLSGQGRTGARQGLDYDLRITGLDDLIKSVLQIRARMQQITNERRPS